MIDLGLAETYGAILDYLQEQGKIIVVAGIPFAEIPAGIFLMGSPESEKGRDADEGPVHEVEITQPFYMGIHQVTQEQYKRVMGKNPSYFSASGRGRDRIKDLDTRIFPVEQVSWDDAVAFCENLSQSEGVSFRLPTEAEWEYACRAGTTTRFHFGDTLSSVQANFNGKYPYGNVPEGPYLERPTSVGSYPPNSLGIYDMHGNVGEWCSDWYESGYYSKSPKKDPNGPRSGEYRVLRGGSWYDHPLICRSACRYWYGASSRVVDVGFRLLLCLE